MMCDSDVVVKDKKPKKSDGYINTDALCVIRLGMQTLKNLECEENSLHKDALVAALCNERE